MWPGSVHRVIGWVLVAYGGVLFIAGIVCLGSALTPLPHPRTDSELRTGGVFRLIRHPIYGGGILLVTGFCLTLASILPMFLALSILVFFDRKAVIEERRLCERYPTYPEYARRTRKFFPWVY
jgi:protein-S-isoprenylcysteine O-methyltransferase Ste14